MLHGVNATCTWVEATGTWISAINAEDETGYAGYNDWRVPNVKELQSIVDYGQFPVPAIDPAFGLTAAFPPYWSLTSTAGPADLAWVVSFSSSTVGTGGKNAFPINVRAVRGP